jgi:hypothetical protein
MPLQNRVMPTGEIVADAGRGLMMGNRGCLHGRDRQLGVSRWRSRAWICCVLEWRGVRRDPMPPGRWTALFFLDEATALAAGHRPRRPAARDMDAVLHRERVGHLRRQLTHRSPPGELPDGVMIRAGGDAGLWLAGRLWPWSFGGYGAPARVSAPGAVEVLTPPSTVATIAAGYRPLVHPSALTAPSLAGHAPPGVRAYA